MKNVQTPIVGLVTLVILFGVVTQVVPTYRKKMAEEQRLKETQEEYLRLEREYQTLQQEIHDLEHRPAAIEKVAREKFNFCRDGEVIYLYTE